MKNPRGRPKTDRKRINIEMDLDVYEEAQSKRLEIQAAEGKEITKIDWNNRLIRLGLKHVKPL